MPIYVGTQTIVIPAYAEPKGENIGLPVKKSIKKKKQSNHAEEKTSQQHQINTLRNIQGFQKLVDHMQLIL